MNYSLKKFRSFLFLATFFLTSFNLAQLKADRPSVNENDNQTIRTPEQERQYNSYFSIIQDLFFYQESVDLYPKNFPLAATKIDTLNKALEDRGMKDQNTEALANLKTQITFCNNALDLWATENNNINDLLIPHKERDLPLITSNFFQLKTGKILFDSYQLVYAKIKRDLFNQAVDYDLAYQEKQSNQSSDSPSPHLPSQN